jgi:hypothetical protein
MDAMFWHSVMKLKIIEIKIYLTIYIIYYNFMVMNIIILKINDAQVFWVQFV